MAEIELHSIPDTQSEPNPAREIVDAYGPNPTDPNIVRELERWNHPRINIYRTLCTYLSFAVLGANDGAYGALIPSLGSYYHLTSTTVSLVFLSPFVGFAASALLNNAIHVHLGRRGAAIIAPSCHLVAYTVNALHPPYPVLVASFIFAGFGNGLLNAAWNAWVGNMAHANEMLGLLHGFYGLGATLSPLIVTTLVTKVGVEWYYFYYIMIGAAAVELIASVAAFWSATGTDTRRAGTEGNARSKNSLRQALFDKHYGRVTWLCAFFLLSYGGTEVALGGWIVTFMSQVRHGSAFSSGMVATGFWIGITVGRFLLGFVTARVGEKVTVTTYLIIIMGLELILWLVPQFYASAIAVSFEGFFLGPLFPAVVIAAARRLPRNLHVTSIGFSSAFSGAGSAVLPFAIGAAAHSKGVQILHPFILGVLGSAFAIWLGLPKVRKDDDEDR